MTHSNVVLEFVGGPFDGHTQQIAVNEDDLSSTVALPVNDNVFRMLDGKHRGPAQPSRTVALYELHRDPGWQYHFIGSRRTAELSLERWCV